MADQGRRRHARPFQAVWGALGSRDITPVEYQSADQARFRAHSSEGQARVVCPDGCVRQLVRARSVYVVLDWLEQAQRRLERGLPECGDLSLSPAEIEALLELAREAAHASGERTNAPLVACLVGLAAGRCTDQSLLDVIDLALGPEK